MKALTRAALGLLCALQLLAPTIVSAQGLPIDSISGYVAQAAMAYGARKSAAKEVTEAAHTGLPTRLQGLDSGTNQPCLIGDTTTCLLPSNATLSAGAITASSTVKATAADPTYGEGSTSNPPSTDLGGYARSLAKQAGTWNITNITGAISLPSGAATAANQSTANTSLSSLDTKASTGNTSLGSIDTKASTTNTQIGGLTEPPPASDTASSGLNGRLQRLAQNVTTLSGLITTLTGKIDTLNAAAADGAVADGAADAGTSTKFGGKCLTSQPAVESTGDRVPALFDCLGKSVVLPYALPASSTIGLITTAMTGTTSTAVSGMGAPSAGLRNYVTEMSCVNAHATVDTLVNIQDGSGGTVIAQLDAPHAYGGHQKTFPQPLRQPTTATALYAVDTITGASVTCSGTGYVAP